MSQRCVRCFRPAAVCYCDAIPTVWNQTEVLILQHRRERFHRFNTARIVHQSLQRCDLLAEHIETLANKFNAMSLSDRVGLLYPGAQARLLSEVDAGEHPRQLIVIDGTWIQSKKLMREIPRLVSLPRYALAPSSPSRYRIRREPNAAALSTLEATVAALQIIEPTTVGFDALLGVFERMVDDQLQNPKSNWRRNEKRGRGVTNSPRALLGDLSNVVIGYGEQERGNRDLPIVPKLIYWTAIRLVTGETFTCAIESPSFADAPFMERLNLGMTEADSAVNVDSFRKLWRDFLRPNDVVAVYQKSTADLLEDTAPEFKPSVILKSINIDGQRQKGTLEVVLDAQGIAKPPPNRSRAWFRMQCAVALVERLKR